MISVKKAAKVQAQTGIRLDPWLKRKASALTQTQRLRKYEQVVPEPTINNIDLKSQAAPGLVVITTGIMSSSGRY